MSTSSTGQDIGHADLPSVIDRFVAAHNAKDADTALTSFTADATVVDDGRTYHGTDGIRAWLASSATEWTYTSTPTAFRRTDDTHYVVVQHVVGDFPGGVVDLDYRLTLNGGLIDHLVIEP
jgi:ketosteroid isomerase-like protein